MSVALNGVGVGTRSSSRKSASSNTAPVHVTHQPRNNQQDHVKHNNNDEPTAAAVAYASAERRLDLGEFICYYPVQYTPAYIHPNQLTALNHILIWPYWCIAMLSQSVHNTNKTIFLLLSCILNWFCMMLDTTDGMHARRTGQVSRIGEYLDHWLDAIHVPLLATGGIHILHFTPVNTIICTILNCAVYHSEMLVYYYQHQWVPTNGVEGQIILSALYILAAGYNIYGISATSDIMLYTGYIVTLITVCSTSVIIFNFMRKFNSTMYNKSILYHSMNSIVAYMYYYDYITKPAYFIITAMLSFRVTGNYVGNSLLKRPYNGHTIDLYIWLMIVTVIECFIDTIYIPINMEFAKTITATVSPIFGSLTSTDVLNAMTVQHILPYIFAVYVMVQQYRTLIANIPEFRKKKV